MTQENPTNPETPEQQAPAPEAHAPATGQPSAGESAAQPPEAPAQPPEASAQPRQQRGGGQRGGGQRGGQRGGRGRRDDRGGGEEGGVESAVVRIYRCSKVVKGGRTFSFGALVIAGDRKGSVGIGYGKANEVPPAVEKATKDARKSLIKVNLKGTTIPHVVEGHSGASKVVLAPARPGTGVTAGKSVRPCLELAGITDVLTKAYGSTSPKNLVKATLDALRRLQSREQVESIRGVQLEKGAGELVAR